MANTEHIMVRVDKQTKDDLERIAEERGETQAEVIRLFLRDSIQNHYGEKSIDLITVQVRKAVRDSMSSFSDRIAKISAKGTISSSTSVYMFYEMLNKQGYDARTIYEKARKKAVENLKGSPENKE